MPELPEVETVVRGLRPRLRGRRIRRLQIRQPLVVRGSLAGFRRALRRARFGQVGRRGKYLLFELCPSGGRARHWWVVHLGMTGQLYACAHAAPLLPHTHMVAWLSSGDQLRFRDPRRFGKMLILADRDLPGHFAALGPEPLRITFERFCALCAGRRAPLKSLLLNQSRLRGLGNIYSSEALYVAGLHPATPAGALRRPALTRLFRAIRGVLREAIAGQGTTVSDYRTGEGLPGEYQNYLRVYDREGKPCPRCGTLIERVVIAGRSAHFCPQCQPRREAKVQARLSRG